MRRRTVNKSKAFTLMEVLLVAGILALLAAFALPRLFGTAEQAKIRLGESAVGRNGPIAKGLEAYKWDMGAYPESDEGLQVLYTAPRSDEGKWKGPYMEGNFEELKDPWGNPYEYKCPGEFNETGYDLWSTGPNGKDDGGKEGSDDIKNWIDK